MIVNRNEYTVILNQHKRNDQRNNSDESNSANETRRNVNNEKVKNG